MASFDPRTGPTFKVRLVTFLTTPWAQYIWMLLVIGFSILLDTATLVFTLAAAWFVRYWVIDTKTARAWKRKAARDAQVRPQLLNDLVGLVSRVTSGEVGDYFDSPGQVMETLGSIFADLMGHGATPEEIREALREAGVPEEALPRLSDDGSVSFTLGPLDD